MHSTTDLYADCFPQKDNPSRRIFQDAKLSTVIFTGRKQSFVDSPGLDLRVFPANSFEDKFRRAYIKFSETVLLDPINTPIPLVDNADWQICTRIHSKKGIVRLGELNDFSVTRGEINQTIYRAFISDNPSHKRLLKGVEVGRYIVREKLSQGHREWFDEVKFLRSNNPKPIAYKLRLATQRITGVDEKLRIVATLIEPLAYFADSTNSIALRDNSQYRLEYALALLNSKLFQWRFKITSTNNNVGTNELESLPFRALNFADKADRARHDRIVGLVEQMFAAKRQLQAARIDRDRNHYENKCAALDRQIDTLIYELYGLTDEEIAIVEGN